MDDIIKAYDKFIRDKGGASRSDLIEANIGNDCPDHFNENQRMRVVDSYINILVEKGLASDNGFVVSPV